MKFGNLAALATALASSAASALIPVPVAAQLLDVLTAPKTLIDRAIEARSASDIVTDNQIVLDVNAIMADLGTIKASTEIYEQRLLVTGLFDNQKLYDHFFSEVRKIKNIKKLYWHVRFMSKEAQARNKAAMIDWADALVLDTKAGLALVGQRGVADVNYRIAADAFATVYLIGRARSAEELAKALTAVRGTEGVRKVVNYVDVRP